MTVTLVEPAQGEPSSQNTDAAIGHPRQNMKPLIALIALVPILVLSLFAIRYWIRRRRARAGERADFQKIETFMEGGSGDRNVTSASTHPKASETFRNQVTATQVRASSNNSGEQSHFRDNTKVSYLEAEQESSDSATLSHTPSVNYRDSSVMRDRVVSLLMREVLDLRARVASRPSDDSQRISGQGNRVQSFENMSVPAPPTYREP